MAVTSAPCLLRTTSEFLSEGARILDVTVQESTLAQSRSLPTTGLSRAKDIPVELVATICRLPPQQISDWQSEGLVSNGEVWQWRDVRIAGLLAEFVQQSAPRYLLEAAPEIIAARTKGKNVLLVRADGFEWVSLRDFEAYPSHFEPYLFYVNWRELETRMHRVRASLAARYHTPDDSDVTDSDED